jgi:hypothetical protein
LVVPFRTLASPLPTCPSSTDTHHLCFSAGSKHLHLPPKTGVYGFKRVCVCVCVCGGGVAICPHGSLHFTVIRSHFGLSRTSWDISLQKYQNLTRSRYQGKVWHDNRVVRVVWRPVSSPSSRRPHYLCSYHLQEAGADAKLELVSHSVLCAGGWVQWDALVVARTGIHDR